MSTSTNEPTGRERRRSEREVLHLPVEIKGESAEGDALSATAEVIAVSKHGAMIQSPQEPRKGSTLKIDNPANSETAEFRVVWTKSVPLEAAWNVGLESVSGGPDLWKNPA